MSNTVGKVPSRYKATSIAAAGAAQGTAAALLPGLAYNVTAADAAKGVRLPVGGSGIHVEVYNNADSALLVYPNVGGAINAGSANASVTVAPRTRASFYSVSALVWAGSFAANASQAETLVNKTLTSPVLSTPVVVDSTEVVAATNVITAAESGKTFFLNHATEFVSTLPAPAAGLRYTFIVTAAPSGASYTIVTTTSANIIKGSIVTPATGAADTETSGGDTINFVDGQAVAGDKVDVYCDGTNWFAYGISSVAAGITITTAS